MGGFFQVNGYNAVNFGHSKSWVLLSSILLGWNTTYKVYLLTYMDNEHLILTLCRLVSFFL